MNLQLNKQLHTLLSANGLMAEKANIVLGFTQGRSESSKELTEREAREMIEWMRSLTPSPSPQRERGDAANKMRRKIISLAYEMHWAKAGDWRAAVAAIDKFCLSEKSLFKKALNAHSYKELVQVVSQFESMYKKYLDKF